MSKIRILYLHLFDHFSSDLELENVCVQEFVGIYESEDERYIKLRYLTADISNINSAVEYHNVLKCAIKYKKEIEINVVDLPDLGSLVRCSKCFERYLGVKEDELCHRCKDEIKISQESTEKEKPE